MQANRHLVLITLLLGACTYAEPRLAFEGRSTVVTTMPTVVDAVVRARNNGSATARLPRPICPLRIAAYPTAERNTAPLWKSGEESCVSDLMIYPPIAIAPRDYFEFPVRVTLPPELANRRVFLSMRLPLVGVGLMLVPIGQVSIGK
jgi:hypothetical protein